jgi:Transposase DDE domain
MEVEPTPSQEKRLMRTPEYTTFAASLTRWLSPWVWKQAAQSHHPKKVSARWSLHPLLMVLLLLTWTGGDSEAERFETARAFYVACRQHNKRPGKSLQGFQQALAKLPRSVLQALFAAVRRCLRGVLARSWRSDGFVVMACDGSRLECPRSAELQKRLGSCGKKDSAPMLFVTARVLLPAGLLWSWCVGPGTASEHDHLRQMLTALPRGTLLVADAFYQGYDLYAEILRAKASFLVRLSSRSQLYTDKRVPLQRFRAGLVWYWPEQAQAQGRPPLRLRLLRVRGEKQKDVWLLTNVLDPQRLSRRRAAELYRWRWHVEGVFRTYKRTLPKIKLWSRTEALVYREAEVSLLALQLLLAQTATTGRQDGEPRILRGSPRQELLRIRGVITTMIGVGLGPRQRQWYQRRLARVQAGGRGRKVRRRWPSRKDHKAPKPPKIRVLPKRLKAKMAKRLDAA